MAINKQELLFVVDENNNPIEPRPRDEVHAKGYWHRNSHVYILNSKNEILCGKRSALKDTNPGLWKAFFGGHLGPGEEYLDIAIKELHEELALTFAKEELLYCGVFKLEKLKEFVTVYLLKKDLDTGRIAVEKEEIEELKWEPFPKLQASLLSDDLAWSRMGYEKEVLDWISKFI